MDHATTRAILVPEIVKLISEKYQIPEMEALDPLTMKQDCTGNPLCIFSVCL